MNLNLWIGCIYIYIYVYILFVNYLLLGPLVLRSQAQPTASEGKGLFINHNGMNPNRVFYLLIQ